MDKNKYLRISEVSRMSGKSKETLRRWDENDLLKPNRDKVNNYSVYEYDKVVEFLSNSINIEDLEKNFVKPNHEYSVLELFAGAGGLAIGLEKAGLKCVALNEVDKWACQTLRKNRPHWNVIEGDIKNVSFHSFKNRIDVVTGGFPCQAFSYAGKKLGLEDTRGTLFYEYARVINEVRPKIIVGENVRGLVSHNKGKTLDTMIDILEDLGYRMTPYKILKAINYKVPQKRERLVLVGVRNDIDIAYEYPKAFQNVFNLKDALKSGVL